MPDNHEPIFLDTAYVYALVNTRDEWHKKALTWQEKLEKERRGIITTELILVEIADGLASIRFRTQAAQVIAALPIQSLRGSRSSFLRIAHPRFGLVSPTR